MRLQERPRLTSCRSTEKDTAQGPDDRHVLESVVAACSHTPVMALPVQLGPLKASFAVDTGAAVNVLSGETFQAQKRVARGSRWSLRPIDLNLVGVTSDSLKILGVVRLPISLGKNTPIIRLDFYVASNFALPTDGFTFS